MTTLTEPFRTQEEQSRQFMKLLTSLIQEWTDLAHQLREWFEITPSEEWMLARYRCDTLEDKWNHIRQVHESSIKTAWTPGEIESILYQVQQIRDTVKSLRESRQVFDQ